MLSHVRIFVNVLIENTAFCEIVFQIDTLAELKRPGGAGPHLPHVQIKINLCLVGFSRLGIT